MPYEIPACAGKPYRPSNGSEGELFIEQNCDRCMHAHGCDILRRSFSYGITDEKYPKEWTHDFKGRPTCTAFVERP